MKNTLFFVFGVGVGVLFSIVVYNQFPQIISQYSKALYNKEGHSSNFESPSRASEKYTFGLDVSKYQGSIKWDSVKQSHHPIKYVFIRSTMGDDRKDIKFKYNWKEVKRIGLIRGAYHYYDPNENSTKQANNFMNFILSEDFQSIIPFTNIMYPVIKINNLPAAYDLLEIPNAIQIDPSKINDSKDVWIEEWLNAS